LERKHRGEVRLTAAAVGEIARVGLVIRRMAAVLRRNDHVEILPAHERAHRAPAPVALGDGETRIGIKLSHGNSSNVGVSITKKFGKPVRNAPKSTGIQS